MATEPQSNSQGYPPSKQMLGERRVCGPEAMGLSLPPKKTPQAPIPVAPARHVGQSSRPSLTH